jgi:hypothetical protein
MAVDKRVRIMYIFGEGLLNDMSYTYLYRFCVEKKYDKASAVIVSNKIKGCIEAWNNSMIKAIKVTSLT